jgi:hypothetical protein
MLECEVLFGVTRGREIQALIEKISGEPCPCKRGLGCLLAPPEDSTEAELPHAV